MAIHGEHCRIYVVERDRNGRMCLMACHVVLADRFHAVLIFLAFKRNCGLMYAVEGSFHRQREDECTCLVVSHECQNQFTQRGAGNSCNKVLHFLRNIATPVLILTNCWHCESGVLAWMC